MELCTGGELFDRIVDEAELDMSGTEGDSFSQRLPKKSDLARRLAGLMKDMQQSVPISVARRFFCLAPNDEAASCTLAWAASQPESRSVGVV